MDMTKENPMRLFLTDVGEIIDIWRGEDEFIVVSCPDLPGCRTQGRTIEEAIENAKDAIEAHKFTPQVGTASVFLHDLHGFVSEKSPEREVVWG